jgi:hypothetical protein
MSLFVLLDRPALAWAALGSLLLIAGAEIYLRIRYRQLLWMRVYPQVYLPDHDLGYRYRPNTVGEIRIPGIHRRFRINNRGFHARDYNAEKPPGIFRIALVGTSNTTGIWMNGQGKNFSEMLEERLRAAGYKVEVMNFGIDGRFRAVYEMRILETDVADYRPDLVLLDVDLPFVTGSFMRAVYKSYVMIYNPESPLSRKWCEHWIDEVSRYRFLAILYRLSYIVRAATRLYTNRVHSTKAWLAQIFVENRIQAPDVVLRPYSLKKSVEAIQAARQEIASRGGKLVLFQYFPSLYYQQVTAKYDLPYIELNVPATPTYVHDLDGHYRYEGHVEVARQLFAQLTDRGLVAMEAPAPVRNAPLEQPNPSRAVRVP